METTADTTTVQWCDQLLPSLQTRVGAAGLVAAGRDGALGAAVGRHEDEVRAWLAGQRLTVSGQSIAGYAAVLLTAAQRCGRQLPADPERYDWSGAEWYLIRLIALCAMTMDVTRPT
ncbi:MAG TPA: DUF6401 family natural product biosynthesis protein [Actinoplanes sp.]|jgi:hypothetical protein